jgi:methylated-DNA-[protein]-cysteine S-methyltransferase
MIHNTQPSLLLHFTAHLGPMVLARSRYGLCGVWFEGQRHFPARLAGDEAPSDALLQEAQGQLTEFFGGTRSRFDLPLDLSAGTRFQQDVWQALLTLGCGHTCSYSALALQLGKPRAVRAVAAAVGRNPLSIVVPCHRVLGADGSLTGYAGGLERKAALLQLEQKYV